VLRGRSETDITICELELRRNDDDDDDDDDDDNYIIVVVVVVVAAAAAAAVVVVIIISIISGIIMCYNITVTHNILSIFTPWPEKESIHFSVHNYNKV